MVIQFHLLEQLSVEFTELFLVLKPLVAKLVCELDVRYSLTIDGWTNCNLKGFWMVTMHWICTKTHQSKSILLTVVNVAPGAGVGGCV